MSFFKSFLHESFSDFPIFYGLQRAIWLADMSGLPFWWIESYRERGLLALLALSGQHVWALTLSLRFILWIIWQFCPVRGSWLYYTQTALPPIAASLLFAASGSWSAGRAWLASVMAFSFHHFPLYVPPLSLAVCVTFLFLLFEPMEILEPSLALSLSGALLLALVPSAGLFQYILFCFVMPIWMMPAVAFWFGKLSVFSFYHQLEISWIWDGILLPVFFLLGIFAMALPGNWQTVCLEKVEMALEIGLGREALRGPAAYFSVPRPGALEALCLMAWLVAATHGIFSRYRKAT